jgi:succinate dehydrogenase / fumarate reductase, cytochrome b subunit
MGATAFDVKLSREIGFYRSMVGRKALVAVTGAMLFGYLVAHLAGNLQILAGPERINAYARLLHSQPGLLWVARLVLVAAVGLHAVATVQLWFENRAARPIPYQKPDTLQATLASRTMIISGPLIAVFVVYHVLHFTTGTVHPRFIELNAYNNVAMGFQNPAASGFYILIMALIGLHLYHGLWSMFQSLGLSHPRYTPWIKRGAAAGAFLIAGGNIFIPLAVLAGLIRPV